MYVNKEIKTKQETVKIIFLQYDYQIHIENQDFNTYLSRSQNYSYLGQTSEYTSVVSDSTGHVMKLYKQADWQSLF